MNWTFFIENIRRWFNGNINFYISHMQLFYDLIGLVIFIGVVIFVF